MSVSYIDPGNMEINIDIAKKTNCDLLFIILLVAILGCYLQIKSLTLGLTNKEKNLP